MGYSGKRGAVTKGSSELSGEIIKWDAELSAYKKEYGHDKSNGWQDVVFGIKRVSGTIEVKLTDDVLDFGPGEFYELELSTGGGTVLAGRAGIEAVPISTVIENGEPVSATYRFVSKGPWTGFPGDTSDGSGSS